jgi:hypothetical protein
MSHPSPQSPVRVLLFTTRAYGPLHSRKVDPRRQPHTIKQHRPHGNQVQVDAHSVVLREQPIELLHLQTGTLISTTTCSAIILIRLPLISRLCIIRY